eukprot:scaffold1724_cov246-Pinguiococcus_pyrenoidosus.AAC.11
MDADGERLENVFVANPPFQQFKVRSRVARLDMCGLAIGTLLVQSSLPWWLFSMLKLGFLGTTICSALLAVYGCNGDIQASCPQGGNRCVRRCRPARHRSYANSRRALATFSFSSESWPCGSFALAPQSCFLSS